MSQKKKCCVIGCNSESTNSKHPLYLYPASTTQRYKRWFGMFPNCFDLYPDKDNYICRRHFIDDSFDSKLRLKHSADPTVDIDMSHAQIQILMKFLSKVVYEWSVRSGVTDQIEIQKKASDVSRLLGLPKNLVGRRWVTTFYKFRETNVQHGVRFSTSRSNSLELANIIEDIHHRLPSNIPLPKITLPLPSEEDVLKVKKEYDSDDDDDDIPLNLYQKSMQEKNDLNSTKVLEKAPDNYQDVLELLKPLAAYISRIGNQNALTRLREVESVVKQVIEDEQRPRKISRKSK